MLLQAPSCNDKERLSTSRVNFLDMISDDEKLMSTAVFSDETACHLLAKVNRHNCPICALEKSRVSVGFERETEKLNVFSACSERKGCEPSFFVENIITGAIYLATTGKGKR
jgi:hypothetical protein